MCSSICGSPVLPQSSQLWIPTGLFLLVIKFYSNAAAADWRERVGRAESGFCQLLSPWQQVWTGMQRQWVIPIRASLYVPYRKVTPSWLISFYLPKSEGWSDPTSRTATSSLWDKLDLQHHFMKSTSYWQEIPLIAFECLSEPFVHFASSTNVLLRFLFQRLTFFEN